VKLNFDGKYALFQNRIEQAGIPSPPGGSFAPPGGGGGFGSSFADEAPF
jgi:hypothetical protein